VTELDRQANLLGAVALVLTDRVETAMVEGHTTAAALSALYHFLDRPSIDQLRQVLGLTPSGTVRLVDRLAGAGLVRRGPGADGRSRSVALTAAGRRAAARLSAARAAALRDTLAELSTVERATLHALLGRLVAGIVQTKDGGAWICRLCDTSACGRPDGRCPVANAAAVRYGSAAQR
jgi:DNA-binding MarR family transcriptional regulator